MRREINFKLESEDGVRYQMRVKHFGGKFKFQFKEKNEEGEEAWNYDRAPTIEELNVFYEKMENWYRRKQAPYKCLQEAERLLKEEKKRSIIT